MLTAMTEEDWTIVLQVFDASRSRRGDKGRDDPRRLPGRRQTRLHERGLNRLAPGQRAEMIGRVTGAQGWENAS